MNKENLYSALLLLLNRLGDIKDNPMQDKTYVIALTEVLRYFRDSGDLKKAFNFHKNMIKNIEEQPFYKSLINMLYSKVNSENHKLPELDINKLYSYIEVIDTEYHISEIDLDASYVEYLAVIKINDKYYSFYYDVCPYRWFEDRIYINQELQEVKPKKETITVYE